MRWKPDKAYTVLNKLSDNHVHSMINSFNEVVNSDINSFVYLLEKLLHYAGSCMFVRSNVTKVKKQASMVEHRM